MARQRLLSLPMSRAIVAFVVVLGLTLALFSTRYWLESGKADIDFAQRAHVRITALTDRINVSIDSLQSVNQLFMVSNEEITRHQFQQITQPYLSKYPYIQSFVFHRLISANRRKHYEASVRKIFPEFKITQLQGRQLVPASARELYLVNDYVEPLKGNEVTLGYDALFDPMQAETFWRATDTGRPAATGLKILLQGEKKGFTIHIPVYRRNALLLDIPSRRAAVIGDTEVVFIAENLVRKILEDTGLLLMPGIHIAVYAADSADAAALVFRNGSQPSENGEALFGFPGWPAFAPVRDVSHTFDLAGKPWHIVVSSASTPLATLHFGSLLILATGIFLSIAVAVRSHAAATQSQRVEELVRQRTAELRATAAALQLRQRAIDASPNAIVIAGAQRPDFPVEYVNPAFERITGYAAKDVIGKPMCLMQGEKPDQEAIAGLEAALNARQEAHAVFRHYRKDGTMYWNDVYIAPVRDERGEIHHYVCMQYDVTATKRYEEELEFRANYDTLTGLANRNLLREQLAQAISYASRYQHSIWIAFIDLDRFKFVNDSLGHHAGDALLQIVAARLRRVVRGVDTVARLGGDEFVLLLPGDGNKRGAEETITQLLAEIAKPALVEGKEFFVTCSVGIAIYPNDGTDPNLLISHADIAMFRAKELGGNNFKFFETSMNASTLKRLQLEGDLRKALDNDEFVLHYQPQIDLQTRKIVGVEALIRWSHPDLGVIPPAQFIGLAEETGLIVQIGKWALHAACAQNKAWQNAGVGKFRVAVNLSAIEFAQPDFVQTITSILTQAQLNPEYLEIEMTESMVMHDVETAILKLHELKALGVKISVDDFGTGYSSLSYLARFPIDVLKIDQSFVQNITTHSNGAVLVTSIISIAHNLHLRVIAEGVETSEQLAFLHLNGCNDIQGYYFSKPLSAPAVEQLLSQDVVWQTS
ncbi:EAL domain-containing protein [Noviherbaspirillum sedimenti]|uniref:EAL domain-containing protein n=1 Tax=Noviherbaspirillum sedimenti TaxID=2320865 RepID=A0A3A3G7M0_9BURK|nr:EAL domain-containing protein [Noviherbaspirillum sedimenti]RJG02552.1 EAL domain-containing protein [Noviherbaspirillum sedimenti]